MTWPQGFVFGWLFAALAIDAVQAVRERKLSHAGVLAFVAIRFAMTLLFAYVLHLGGFW